MTASRAAVAEPDLIARREGAAGIIRLNRPKAINAVTLEMFRDVDKALDEFESDPAVGLILLEGVSAPAAITARCMRVRRLEAISARSCGARSTFSTRASPNSQNPMWHSWTAS